jgi:hypothetical protein
MWCGVWCLGALSVVVGVCGEGRGGQRQRRRFKYGQAAARRSGDCAGGPCASQSRACLEAAGSFDSLTGLPVTQPRLCLRFRLLLATCCLLPAVECAVLRAAERRRRCSRWARELSPLTVIVIVIGPARRTDASARRPPSPSTGRRPHVYRHSACYVHLLNRTGWWLQCRIPRYGAKHR